MSNLAEYLSESVRMTVQNEIQKLDFDQTITALIYQIVNLDTGEYRVKYKGGIFSVYSDDLNKTYRVDENVYVKIPQGNFSNKKFIQGRVTDYKLSEEEINKIQNSIEEVGPTFDYFYKYDWQKSYGVIAGAPQGSSHSYEYIIDGPPEIQSSQYNGLFQQYAKKYEYIRISAEFLTALHSEHTQGNYGIEIEFYANDNTIVKYRLDFNEFIGDPYRFSVYSPQSVIVKVQKNYLMGLKSIKLFEENFIYDRYVKNGQVTTEQNTTHENIFVKNIKLQYVEVLDLSNNLFYLTIQTPKGNLLTTGTPTIDLVGRLVYQGKSILDRQNCVCKWFKRNLSVMIGIPQYDKQAGYGWEPVSNNTFNVLQVSRSQVPHQQAYKLVVIYQNDTVVSAEVEVFRYNSDYDYEIQQTTQLDTITLSIHNLKNDKQLRGDWYMSLPDGSYQEFPNGKMVNSIDISDYMIYTSVIFHCAIYDYVYEKVIGTVDFPVLTTETDEDVEVTFEGEDFFKYDANGDITIEDSEKERTLQCFLNWQEGFGSSYKIEWLAPDGTVLTPYNRQSPRGSMIQELWVDNYDVLHFTIKQKYRVNDINNTVTIRITTIDQKIYLFEKEIIFIKDGDQGTNGTTYVTAIRPCDSNGSKLSGLQPLVYNGLWINSLRLRAYVYKDGVLINNMNNYHIEYEWDARNLNISTNSGEYIVIRGINSISSSSPSSELEFFIRLSVKITDNKGKKIQIYATYPVDVLVGGLTASLVDISSIPSYIKYTSSGVNPLYFNDKLEFIYNEQDYSNNIQSLNEKVLKLKEEPDGKYLDPAANFIFENDSNYESNIGILKCSVDSSNYLIHPIIMYLDNYGNEAINGWDGTRLVIDEENGQYIFAPQIGAGEKDSYNRFTGVVMGKYNESGIEKIGLYGYKSGLNTFGLMEDGKAFFGAKTGGGQIVIDGTSAMIYGGDGPNAENGMTITLADKSVDGKITKAINIGNGKTYINYDGYLYSKYGKIGGWNITENQLYCKQSSADQTRAIYLDSNVNSKYGIWLGSNNPEHAKFSVTKDGVVYSIAGEIGGWTLNDRMLYSGSGSSYVALSSKGNSGYAIWCGNENPESADFLVTRSGRLYAKRAEIDGNIVAQNLYLGDKGNQINVGRELNGLKLRDKSVSGDKISNNAISTEHIQASAITAEKIQAGSITTHELNAEEVQAKIVTAEYINGLDIIARRLHLEGGGGYVTFYRSSQGGVRLDSNFYADELYVGSMSGPIGKNVEELLRRVQALENRGSGG